MTLALAGCGVTETGVSAGAAAESAAQQAAQDHVRQQIGAAYSEAAEQRRAADADGR
jgi:hypothetical protein